MLRRLALRLFCLLTRHDYRLAAPTGPLAPELRVVAWPLRCNRCDPPDDEDDLREAAPALPPSARALVATVRQFPAVAGDDRPPPTLIPGGGQPRSG